MGEIIDITTRPNHELKFYKITSGALTFSIKGERHYVNILESERRAAVGLAKTLGTCDYWIVITSDKIWLESPDGNCLGNVRKVPNILRGNEYKKFWVSWHKALLQFGRTNDGVPLISKKMLTKGIQYVTFNILSNRGMVEWKLHLPPKIEKPVLKNVSGGELKWVTAKQGGQLPHGALIGGYEEEILYIIRAYYTDLPGIRDESSLIPGKYVASKQLGYLSLPNMPETKEFEVLCGYNCFWIPISPPGVTAAPKGAVEGGFDSFKNEKLYIGRTLVEDNLIPGQVLMSHSSCIVPYNMVDIAKQKFEILVDPIVYLNSFSVPLTLETSRYSGILEDQSHESSDSEV